MKSVYKVDKFTDFNGVEREFIIAAVSVDVDKDSENTNITGVDVTLYDGDEDYIDIKSQKVLLLGVSIRNANDTYDEKLGKRIAFGRALKMLSEPWKNTGKIIVVNDKGIINTAVVTAILDQEAEYFKRNPDSYIAGYAKKAKK
jgi:hypothetical protein